MARCGRCGLWSKYSPAHSEQKYAGVCLWYQTRLVESEVFESRECGDFFERIPDLTALNHFDYKVKRDGLGDSYIMAKNSKRISLVALSLSAIGLVWNILKIFLP